MVSNASEDFPEPETPVTTVKELWGTSKSIFLRLWTRAPRTTMLSVGIKSEDIGLRAGNPASPSAPAQTSPQGQPNLSIIRDENVARAPSPALPDEEKMKSMKVGFVLSVPLLPIANRVAKPKQHDPYGRRQHHKNPAVDRSLTFLRRSLGVRAAHGTPLGKRWSDPARQNRSQQHPTKL